MRKLIFILSIFLLAGCNTAEETKLVSGIIIENMDPSINPGDNFFNYINGSWVKDAVIPPDKSSYGIVSIIREQADENVKNIIEESSDGEFEKGSDEQKVGDLYRSYMNLEKRNEIGFAPLQPEFDKIDAISSYKELSVYFAYADKHGYYAPLTLFVDPDFKDPTVYTVYVWQGGLGLPEREYYLKEDERSEEIKLAYIAHIEKMFDLAQLEGGNHAAKAIMELETILAENHLEKEKTRDRVQLYNMLEVSTLQDMMPNFDWNGYLVETGIASQDKLGVMMIDYTTALNDIMTRTDLDIWKNYLKWGVLNACSNRLNEALNEQDFAFYSGELMGTEEQRPLWRRGTAILNQHLGEVVGKVYVK